METTPRKDNKSNYKYKKKTYKYYRLMLRKDTQQHLIDKIESQPSKSAYLAKLIEDDVNKQ